MLTNRMILNDSKKLICSGTHYRIDFMLKINGNNYAFSNIVPKGFEKYSIMTTNHKKVLLLGILIDIPGVLRIMNCDCIYQQFPYFLKKYDEENVETQIHKCIHLDCGSVGCSECVEIRHCCPFGDIQNLESQGKVKILLFFFLLFLK